ncbi:hypothetical protein [Gracilibacillus saliphilus]|uniref:hypothetical protein n=1 Tax=Gracilibacillus saliphilus TaxID=543890 RepID=UPI0013CF7CDF|nr:hypothetical protein [Gracilibacillus saliphilus]
MNEKNDQLDIENLNEVLAELQQEVQSIKGDVEKLRIAKLIDRLELFINEMNGVKQDVDQLQQGLTQLRTPTTSKKTNYQPSEYSKLQRMLQSVQTDSSNTTSKKWNNSTTEVTAIHHNK